MKKIVLIDGNSILNRAFYGIMGNKMLMTTDGKYTNAVYGFLAILFKVLEDIEPEYLMVTFDLKAPTARHKLYDGYKANRKGMPNELAEQMPILKDILRSMNIAIIEKEGYEADDVLGTMAKKAEKDGFDVTIVSGDRDTFQLTSKKIKVRIPHTKVGKTETETFDENAIIEKYGVTPKQLIEVKGLQGDTSDNIPGVPGIGEKTALELVKKYKSIDGLYEAIEKGEDDLKPKTKEKLIENKELAEMSKFLGTINLEVPIDENPDEFKIKEWNKEEVLNKFKELNFNRYIERFNLSGAGEGKKKKKLEDFFKLKELDITSKELNEELEHIKNEKRFTYYFEKTDGQGYGNSIIKQEIKSICFVGKDKNTIVYVPIDAKNENCIKFLSEIFESKEINKIGYKIKPDFIMLKELGIEYNNIKYDAEIAGYNLNPTDKNTIEEMSLKYLEIDISEILEQEFKGAIKEDTKQINLFDTMQENDKTQEETQRKTKLTKGLYCYVIEELEKITVKKLAEEQILALFNNIEMPLLPVLAEMQFNGMLVDRQELINLGVGLKEQLEQLTKEIYDLCGEEFNINSHQQLGKILFEKLQLPVYKKTKNGYTTDVDVLEKLKDKHPVIEKILEYRTLTKLNSTYIEGLMPYINKKTSKIHSSFHQTITATGRISSTEPNLQNIPTRAELGKQIRKAFKPAEGNVYIDADYSQVELRVLAHISQDENMTYAFKHGEDIHRQVASKILNIPMEEVTKEQRSSAKAVNFGIVYGISDYGLANQIGVSNKEAKEYISQYLEKYSGIKQFMADIVESAKEKGYVETLFGRRRYVPEIKSNNYMVRQFGARVAMNTPIQGTAADIMKIAMINVYKTLKEEKIEAKIVLQIHDELLLEVKEEDKEKAEKILKDCMENAKQLSVPLEVEVSEGSDWYEVK